MSVGDGRRSSRRCPPWVAYPCGAGGCAGGGGGVRWTVWVGRGFPSPCCRAPRASRPCCGGRRVGGGGGIIRSAWPQPVVWLLSRWSCGRGSRRWSASAPCRWSRLSSRRCGCRPCSRVRRAIPSGGATGVASASRGRPCGSWGRATVRHCGRAGCVCVGGDCPARGCGWLSVVTWGGYGGVARGGCIAGGGACGGAPVVCPIGRAGAGWPGRGAGSVSAGRARRVGGPESVGGVPRMSRCSPYASTRRASALPRAT